MNKKKNQNEAKNPSIIPSVTADFTYVNISDKTVDMRRAL